MLQMERAFNVCATRRPTKSGGGCKGLRHQGLVPVASWGSERGVGAWTVAMETATTARPFAPSHTDKNRWSKSYGKEGKRGGGGRGEKAREIPANDSFACTTKRGDERTRRNAPNGAHGANKVLGLASLNINLYQQT